MRKRMKCATQFFHLLAKAARALLNANMKKATAHKCECFVVSELRFLDGKSFLKQKMRKKTRRKFLALMFAKARTKQQ